jgi:hypothetical protein
MQTKMFNSYQILLFVHNCDAFKAEEHVKLITNDLGFSQNILINTSKTMPVKSLFAGFFEGEDPEILLSELKEKIYSSCDKHNFGVLDFFLIDATNAAMLKGMWHDGFY